MDILILLFCGAAFLAMNYLHNKWTPSVYDQETEEYVSETMLHILSAIYSQVCIFRPADIASVRQAPIRRSGKWIYRAKGTQIPTALTDQGSLLDYAALINRRAADTNANIKVSKVHLQGQFFVYDVIYPASKP